MVSNLSHWRSRRRSELESRLNLVAWENGQGIECESLGGEVQQENQFWVMETHDKRSCALRAAESLVGKIKKASGHVIRENLRSKMGLKRTKMYYKNQPIKF